MEQKSLCYLWGREESYLLDQISMHDVWSKIYGVKFMEPKNGQNWPEILIYSMRHVNKYNLCCSKVSVIYGEEKKASFMRQKFFI